MCFLVSSTHEDDKKKKETRKCKRRKCVYPQWSYKYIVSYCARANRVYR